MPNYCANFLQIVGPEDDLQSFLEQIQTEKEEFTMDILHPIPSELEGYSNDWCSKHWGTKWEPMDADVTARLEDEIISINYNTAWSPNENWVYYVSKLFPSLLFQLDYEEGGSAFAGRLLVQNGGLLLDDCEGGAQYRIQAHATDMDPIENMYDHNTEFLKDLSFEDLMKTDTP